MNPERYAFWLHYATTLPPEQLAPMLANAMVVIESTSGKIAEMLTRFDDTLASDAFGIVIHPTGA